MEEKRDESSSFREIDSRFRRKQVQKDDVGANKRYRTSGKRLSKSFAKRQLR